MGRILRALSATFAGIFVLSVGCYAFTCMAFQGSMVESVESSHHAQSVQTLAANPPTAKP